MKQSSYANLQIAEEADIAYFDIRLATYSTRPHSTILEDSYAMGTPKKPYPGEKYEKAVATGIINPAKSVNSETNMDPFDEHQERKGKNNATVPDSQDPETNLSSRRCRNADWNSSSHSWTLLAANWREIQKSLAEFFLAT